eukprot:764554-Hanusia_phi.AAC.4
MAASNNRATEKLVEAVDEEEEMEEIFEPFSLSRKPSADRLKDCPQSAEELDGLNTRSNEQAARTVQSEYEVTKGSQVCVKWDKKWSPATDGWSEGVVLEISDGKIKNPNGRGLVSRGWSLVLYEGRDVHIHLLDRVHHVHFRGNRRFAWKRNEKSCSIDLTEFNDRSVIKRYPGKRKVRPRTKHIKSRPKKVVRNNKANDEKENETPTQNIAQDLGKSFSSSGESLVNFSELNQKLGDSDSQIHENLYDIAGKPKENDEVLSSEDSLGWVLKTSDIQPHNLTSVIGDSMCDCPLCTGKNSLEKISSKDPISDFL